MLTSSPPPPGASKRGPRGRNRLASAASDQQNALGTVCPSPKRKRGAAASLAHASGSDNQLEISHASTTRLHLDRAPGGHRDHWSLSGPPAPRGPESARGREPPSVCQ